MQNLVIVTTILMDLGWPFETAHLRSQKAPWGEDRQDLAAVRPEQALLPAAEEWRAWRVGRRHQAPGRDTREADGPAGRVGHLEETGISVRSVLNIVLCRNQLNRDIEMRQKQKLFEKE